jgi:DNA-binding transcriptional MerR regulator
MDEKSPDAFRTISEAAEELDLPQHVLRFWESRFREIKPMKRGGGRRFYRPDDLDLLRGIKHLLYGEGYTIRGVQRLLRENGIKFVQAVWEEGAAQPPHGAAEEEEVEEAAETEILDGEDGEDEGDGEDEEKSGLGSRLGGLLGRDLNARPLPLVGGRREPPLSSAPLPQLSTEDRAIHTGGAAVAPSAPVPAIASNPEPRLTEQQVRILRGVLQDLIDCRQLIDTVAAGTD